MTKTEQKLLSRTRYADGQYTTVNGKREHDAANKLVASGAAVSYEGGMTVARGEYYIDPATGRQAISKTVYLYGGKLYFK